MCVLINILLFCNKTFYFWLAFSCIQYISNAKLISIMAFFFSKLSQKKCRYGYFHNQLKYF